MKYLLSLFLIVSLTIPKNVYAIFLGRFSTTARVATLILIEENENKRKPQTQQKRENQEERLPYPSTVNEDMKRIEMKRIEDEKLTREQAALKQEEWFRKQRGDLTQEEWITRNWQKNLEEETRKERPGLTENEWLNIKSRAEEKRKRMVSINDVKRLEEEKKVKEGVKTAYEDSVKPLAYKTPSESQKVTATDSCKNTF